MLYIPELEKQLLQSSKIAKEHTNRLLLWDIFVPSPDSFTFNLLTGAPFFLTYRYEIVQLMNTVDTF